MALILKNKDGIWYWSDGNPGDATVPAALYGNVDAVFLPTASTSPPIADVVCPRSITFTLPGSPSAIVKVVEDAGNLDFTVSITGPKADISGLFFDFTNSKLPSLYATGLQITQFVTGAGSVINLTNGVNMNGAKVPNFDVGMEFGLAGIGSDHQNISNISFVLSDGAHDLSIDDLHPANETGTVGVRDLSVGQKLTAVAPYAPTATPDTVTTPEDVKIVIPVSALATDKNAGAILKISEIGSGFEGPQYGTVTVASDGLSLTYTPTTLDYLVDGILTGNKDAFQVCVTDNFGGEVTSFVTVNATPVADTPTVVENVATPHAADPATLFRFSVTVTSEDFGTITQGSDFIKSLGLSVTGTNPGAITVTDSLGFLSGGVITPPANPGSFTDEIEVSIPAGSAFSDTLSMTGTNAEIEDPTVTAGKTVSQTITADTETTLEDVATVIPISHLVSAPNMLITGIGVAPKYGTVNIASDGQSLTYTPTTLDAFVNGTPTGDQDVFQVYSSDGAGNNAVTLVTVKETPVADTPSLTVKLLPWQPGDPVTETKFLVTATSGDFGSPEQGSDYIKSLLFSGLPGGVTLKDGMGLLSGTSLVTSGNPGQFTDEIDVFAPSALNTNFTLGITAFNDEIEGSGSPAEASNSASQPIIVDYSSVTQPVDFSATDQSIWDTGGAFKTDFNKFLGINTGASTSLGGTLLGAGLTVGASFHIKTGFQMDLHINSGSFNADLPYNITFNDTYNKINDTLEIDPSDVALSGAHIQTFGPNGSFSLDFVFDAMASASIKLSYIIGSTSTSVGAHLKTTLPIVHFNSTTAKTVIPIPPGDPIANLTFAWPVVNAGPTTGGPGTIHTEATSNPIVNLDLDLVALALAALGISPDPLKGSVLGVDYDLLSADVSGGIDVKQAFDLNELGLKPSFTLEDGTVVPFTFGGPVYIQNASLHDQDHNGSLGMTLNLTPDASLHNNTTLAAQIGFGVTALKIDGFDPLHFGATIPLGNLGSIYNKTFAVNFQSANLNFTQNDLHA